MELEVVRHLARSALQNLEAHRRRIDDLNVYPVPDGDTGTNLTLTLRSIVEALDASTATDSEAVASYGIVIMPALRQLRRYVLDLVGIPMRIVG